MIPSSLLQAALKRKHEKIKAADGDSTQADKDVGSTPAKKGTKRLCKMIMYA
jgi:hypothetical protein